MTTEERKKLDIAYSKLTPEMFMSNKIEERIKEYLEDPLEEKLSNSQNTNKENPYKGNILNTLYNH